MADEPITEEMVVQRIDALKRDGLLEVHPDDHDKPWEEQRLRQTDFARWLLKTKPPRKRRDRNATT